MKKIIMLLAALLIGLASSNLKAQTSILRVIGMGWNGDGSMLAVGYSNGNIDLYEDSPLQLLRTLHTGIRLSHLAWSPTENHLLAAVSVNEQDMKSIQLFDVSAGEPTVTLGSYAAVGAIAWSPDGKQIAVGFYPVGSSVTQHPGIEIFDVSSGVKVNSLPADIVTDLAWSPDGSALLVAYADGSHNALVAEIDPYNVLYVLRGHSGHVYSVAWSPDGTELATGSEDNTVIIWDASTGKARQTLDARVVKDMMWCPTGDCIAIAGLETFVFDFNAQKQLFRVTSQYENNAVAFSKYGGRLAYGGTSQADQQLRGELFPFSIVPIASADRLQSIADSCLPDRLEILPNGVAALLSTVEALPVDAIPAVCRADLLAVAKALMEQP
jgi:WD40 repeat protein